jgi:site-specific recombinase XerD
MCGGSSFTSVSTVGESVINGSASGLRFLFDVTLERPDLSRRLVLARRPRKLPDVLGVEEVAKLLEAAPGSSTGPPTQGI